MLTPEQLTACTDDIVELYRQLEDSIIQKIVKVLAKGTFTEGKADLVLRLQQSGKLYDDIVKEVTKHSGLSDEAVKVLFEDACVQSVAFDNKIYKEAGMNIVNQMSPAALHVLEANIEKTGSFLNNLTKTTASVSQQSFISACTLAEMQIESGAFSYTEAVRQAIHNVIDNGAEVLYPSGHRDKLDVAVRRAALTGVGQTTGEISLKNAEELGCDLMEITAHFGARPSHAEWQGKIVSLSGKEGYLSLSDIGYGTGAGFKGWNCRHDWFPFFEDISEKAYSNKELEQRKNETVTYNDKTMSRYDAEQKQRAMERQIRKERSKLAGLDTAIKASEDDELKTSLKNDFDNLSVKLKSHEAKYKDFSYKTGLPPQKQRLQMYGFNRSVSQKAVYSNKKLKQTGGKYTVGDIEWVERRDNEAKTFYETIRRTDDVKAISKTSGLSIEDIQTIKNHIFFDEHIKYGGEIDRFDPDYDIAVAWKRLSQGNPKERDILFLHHELLENQVEKVYNLSAAEAHEIANQTYNWQDKLFEELGEAGEKDGLL